MNTRSTTEHLSSLSVAVMAMLTLFVSGCGKSALPPPVTVTYRDSLVGVGKVIQITNNSSHHLYNVRVVGRNYQEVSSASVKATDHLRPHETVEVGCPFPADPGLLQLARRLGAGTAAPGNAVRLFRDGVRTFDALERDIDAAAHHIHLDGRSYRPTQRPKGAATD